ncbi:hypothetical protein AVEN_173149-1 [Araneus ventricosus]|uniref:Uncharacterized protein n=1 Tax=Araneus ventricosus TaxID=182803 RepID=A0A4Y2FMP8_ARAVE|nr:hypothetical protein AVEN_173149-1 [Araneus ventricosus]
MAGRVPMVDCWHSIDRSLKPDVNITDLGISSTHLEYHQPNWLEESLWWITKHNERSYNWMSYNEHRYFPTHLEYLLFKAWLVASFGDCAYYRAFPTSVFNSTFGVCNSKVLAWSYYRLLNSQFLNFMIKVASPSIPLLVT